MSKANGAIVLNEADRIKADILRTLDMLGGLTVADDTLRFEGSAFVLPSSLEGNVRGAIEYLEEWEESQETDFEYSRTYPFRPYDGAAAFDRTMRKVFGSSGIGKATFSMFGVQPPELITIDTGVGTSTQVPWGRVAFGMLSATFTVGAARGQHGPQFQLSVVAPRKHRKRIEGFFDVVGRELATESIYRGKAITGATNPEFIDPSRVDPTQVVYSAEVMTQLGANLWSLLDHSQVMRDLGIPLKRAVLVEGPYGTGKTLAGALTAQRAVANGWTYVVCRPGQDNLMVTLETARLYAPAVVWFEDIDTIGGTDGSSMFLSQLLDALDGMLSKGVEIIAGFTTNHVERLQKGLLRPGRIDTVIHIGELDAPGIRRLVEVVVPPDLLGNAIDWAAVAEAFHGYVPAFAREAIDRAMRYSIARNGGLPDEVNGSDLIAAANGLRAQHKLMADASEDTAKITIESIMAGVITNVAERTVLPDHGSTMTVEPVDYATAGLDDD